MTSYTNKGVTRWGGVSFIEWAWPPGVVTPGRGHLSPSRSPPPRPSGTCARPEAKGQRPNSPRPAPPARPRPPDLCVIPDWLSSVTCPALSISHPAWAIMAPLSMQYLGVKGQGSKVRACPSGASGPAPQAGPALTCRPWGTARRPGPGTSSAASPAAGGYLGTGVAVGVAEGVAERPALPRPSRCDHALSARLPPPQNRGPKRSLTSQV